MIEQSTAHKKLLAAMMRDSETPEARAAINSILLSFSADPNIPQIDFIVREHGGDQVVSSRDIHKSWGVFMESYDREDAASAPAAKPADPVVDWPLFVYHCEGEATVANANSIANIWQCSSVNSKRRSGFCLHGHTEESNNYADESFEDFCKLTRKPVPPLRFTNLEPNAFGNLSLSGQQLSLVPSISPVERINVLNRALQTTTMIASPDDDDRRLAAKLRKALADAVDELSPQNMLPGEKMPTEKAGGAWAAV